MDNNTSTALTDVWEAKEKLFQEIKNIPVGKRVEYLQEKAKATMEKYFKKKAEKQ